MHPFYLFKNKKIHLNTSCYLKVTPKDTCNQLYFREVFEKASGGLADFVFNYGTTAESLYPYSRGYLYVNREAYEAYNLHQISKYRFSYNYKAIDLNKDGESHLDTLLGYIKMKNVIIPATEKFKIDPYSDEPFDKLATGEVLGPVVLQFHELDDRLKPIFKKFILF